MQTPDDNQHSANSCILQPFKLEYSDLTLETMHGEWVLDEDLVKDRYYEYLRRNKAVSL